jgi:hypothetical protein
MTLRSARLFAPKRSRLTPFGASSSERRWFYQ